MAHELLLKVEGPAGRISLGAFLKMMGNARLILSDLDSQISDGPRSVRVIISELKNASAGAVVALAPRRDDVSPEVIDTIEHSFIRGLRMLEAGEALPAFFTEKNVERARRLSQSIGSEGAEGFTAEIVGTNERATITKQMASNVVELSAPHYVSHGSVIGLLDVISARSGTRFGLSDALHHRPVTCTIPDSELAGVKDAFRQRVRVSGVIHRNAYGQPVRVEDPVLYVYPPDDDLPTLDDIYGIDPGFTGEQSVDQYVSELRG